MTLLSHARVEAVITHTPSVDPAGYELVNEIISHYRRFEGLVASVSASQTGFPSPTNHGLVSNALLCFQISLDLRFLCIHLFSQGL